QDGSDGTYAGIISGTGSVEKIEGTGTVTLTGANTYSGGTLVQVGTLAGDTTSLQGIIDVEGGVLRFDQGFDATFIGSLDGLPAGTVEKRGVGILTLDTFVTDADFLLDVVEGAVVLDAIELFGDVTVRSGALLSGQGTLRGDTQVFGSLYPDPVLLGGSSLSVPAGGSLSLEDGSTLFFDILGDGQGGVLTSRIAAAGGLSIVNGAGGSTIDVSLDFNAGVIGEFWVVADNATSDRGDAAPFDTIVGTSVLTFDVLIDAISRELRVTVTGVDFQGGAESDNQIAVSIALEELFTDPLVDVDELKAGLNTISSEEYPAALDTMGGDMLGAFTTARITNSERFSRAVARRFTASVFELRDLENPDRLALNALAEGTPFSRFGMAASGIGAVQSSGFLGRSDFGWSPGRTRSGLGVWVDAFGVFSDLDGGSESRDIDSRVYGTTLGFDYRLPRDMPLPGGRTFSRSENLRFGVSAGYTRISFESAPTPATGSSNGYHGALYGSFTMDRFYVGALGRFGASMMETDRRLTIGTFDYTAHGEFDGKEASGYVETGALFGDPEVIALTPTFGFGYTWLDQDGFTETGGDALNLAVAGTSASSMATQLGLRISRVLRFDPSIFDGGPTDQFGIEPEARFAWNHEFGDVDRLVDGSFVGAGSGGLFQVRGAESKRDSFIVGAGYTMRIQDIALISAHYDARLDSRRTDHGVRAALYFAW
ncbi:MAG: autotransporter domain-containing protein, partial [Deltaproteobacteria bacterium]|nr:autotransporter domain-containing protein [Deltaproteobacteria bacterium]